MDTTPATTAEDRRDALVEQLFGSTVGALETFHVYLGRTLGLYDVLADGRARSAVELARDAGIDARYAREWLEQQACSGVLDVAEDADDPDTRRFAMPPEVDAVVRDPHSLYLMAPLSAMVVGIASALPEVVAAFRTGAGVPYEAYGPDIRRGIADVNRPGFEHLLRDWLAALPDVRERLDGPDARIADLGCGTGASTLALATACPGAQVDGIDLDAASVEEAAELAAAAGLADRVRVHHADAAESRFAGEYQLVTLFETLHDMARPVEALAAARGMLTEGGAVLVGDEKVAEAFTAPGDELERFNYGWSALHCLAAAMGEPGTEATGTAMRADRVAAYATRAGFSRCTVLDIEHDFWRFYRLDP